MEYGELLELLSSKPSLQDVISEACNPCPISIQKLVGELSRETPTCGMIQISGNINIQAHNVLIEMANGNDTEFNRTFFDNMELLKKSCPLLIEFFYLKRSRHK